jgi:cysteine desulfurase family protein
VVYLDNAATSWPKPEAVYRAADEALRFRSGNPGRSGHKLSLAAGRVLEETRFLAARLFNIPKPENVIFTLNATDAINLALKGLLKKGDHVLTSAIEHNSVARPLEALRAAGVEVSKVPASPLTGIDIAQAAIRPNTRLAVVTHVSNVTGTVNPVAALGALCRSRGIVLLVDAAQSAGVFPIDVEAMNIDLLAFPGHKGLLGPQGTGGLYIREGLVLAPLREGGTGSRSEDLTQPASSPDRYESGTANTAGLAGLGAGIKFILETGVEAIHRKEAMLASRLIEGLARIEGVSVYGPPAGDDRSGVVSFNIKNRESGQAAAILDSAFDIAVRAGLHCAVDAHRSFGTLDGGTIRASAGYFNSPEDIDRCLEAVRELAE